MINISISWIFKGLQSKQTQLSSLSIGTGLLELVIWKMDFLRRRRSGSKLKSKLIQSLNFKDSNTNKSEWRNVSSRLWTQRWSLSISNLFWTGLLNSEIAILEHALNNENSLKQIIFTIVIRKTRVGLWAKRTTSKWRVENSSSRNLSRALYSDLVWKVRN